MRHTTWHKYLEWANGTHRRWNKATVELVRHCPRIEEEHKWYCYWDLFLEWELERPAHVNGKKHKSVNFIE